MEIKNDDDALNAVMQSGLVGVADYIGARLFDLSRRPATYIGYTHEEMVNNARKWMEANYPKDDRDEWHMRYGLLIDFVTDYFPQTNTSMSYPKERSE